VIFKNIVLFTLNLKLIFPTPKKYFLPVQMELLLFNGESSTAVLSQAEMHVLIPTAVITVTYHLACLQHMGVSGSATLTEENIL
jgi:hypothetical protein